MKYLIVLFLCFCFTLPCSASKLSIGARESVFNPDDDNLKNTLFTQVYLAYEINEYLDLELESGFLPIRSKKNRWSDGSSFVEIPTTINAVVKWPVNDRLTLYGVYGYGRSFFVNKDIAFNESLNASNSRCAKYGGGAKWNISKTLSLNGEVSYHYSDTDKGSSLDSWGWFYGCGVEYEY